MKCKEGKRVHWLYIDWEIQQRHEAFERAVAEKRKKDLLDALTPIMAAGAGFALALLAIWLTP